MCELKVALQGLLEGQHTSRSKNYSRNFEYDNNQHLRKTFGDSFRCLCDVQALRAKA
jgi:hypothetical protein